MIRIGRLTDYALLIMTQFVPQPDRTVLTVRELANGTRLPSPTVSKVLKLMSQAGLVRAHRGSRGGYSLQRPADEISVAQVISAIEGPIAITLCSVESDCRCEFDRSCQMRDNWRKINQTIHTLLDNVTLTQMSMPLPEPLVNVALPGERRPSRLPVDDA